MDIESQKSRYREYIRRLTTGIDIHDRQKLLAAYEKLRAANEQFFRNNDKTVGPEQASLLRAALEEVIGEHEGEVAIGAALSAVDFSGDTPVDPVRPEPEEIVSADAPAEADEQVAATEPDAWSPEKADGPETPDRLAGDRPAVVATPLAVSRRQTSKAPWLLGGVALGLIAAAGSAYALVSTHQIGVLRDKGAIVRNAEFESRYAKDFPQIDTAVDFLRQVEAGVVERQKTAGDKLAAGFSKKWRPVKDFDAELAKKQPAGLPDGTRVVIRADAKGYKVLMQSRLCQAAGLTDPALIDPVRDPDGLGCINFGFWNADGAKF